MSHSATTSSKHYQLPAAKKAVDVYKTIKNHQKDFYTKKILSFKKNGLYTNQACQLLNYVEKLLNATTGKGQLNNFRISG